MAVDLNVKEFEAYCARLQAASLDAPWSRPGPLIEPKRSKVEPCMWRWADIEPLLRRSAEFVAPDRGAERRILRLANPGVPERTSAHTLSLAVQYLLPGESAPLHRHTPNAIRFMLQGTGACTKVGDQICQMAPGDLVLTPSLSWHEHWNAGEAPVIWLDGLDSPVVRYLETLVMHPGPERSEPAAQESSRPLSALPAPDERRPLHYRWDDMYPALVERAASASDPFDDVVMEYVDPTTGHRVIPTLGCYLQMLRPGVRTRAHRQTSCAVYQVFRGSGSTMVDDVTYEWRQGDFFVVPPLTRHAHANEGADPAVLFSLQDVPLLTALGLYYED